MTPQIQSTGKTVKLPFKWDPKNPPKIAAYNTVEEVQQLDQALVTNKIQERCIKERDRFFREQGVFPTRIVEIFNSSGYFAGGCIASQILDEEPKDWDIFLSTEKCRNEIRAYYEKNKSHVICITDNAITLKGGFQIITCEFAPPTVMTREIFDFMHTRGWFQFKGYKGGLFIPAEVWMCCHFKRLIPTLPVEKMSAERIQRFLKRGWTLDHGEMEGLKILAECDLGDDQPSKSVNMGGQQFTDSWGS